MRRRYPLKLYVNDRRFDEVLIDPHFEQRHGREMTDEIILALVRSLSGLSFVPDARDDAGFEYFKTEPLWFGGRPYRLVWLTHPEESYVGVRNAFRVKRRSLR